MEAPRRAPEPPNERPLIAGLVVALVFSAECGAAYAAWRFGKSVNLGEATFVVPAELRQRLAATSVLLTGVAATLLMTKRVYRFAGMLMFAAILCLIGSRGSVYSPLHLV